MTCGTTAIISARLMSLSFEWYPVTSFWIMFIAVAGAIHSLRVIVIKASAWHVVISITGHVFLYKHVHRRVWHMHSKYIRIDPYGWQAASLSFTFPLLRCDFHCFNCPILVCLAKILNVGEGTDVDW